MSDKDDELQDDKRQSGGKTAASDRADNADNSDSPDSPDSGGEGGDKELNYKSALPVVPLRDVVVFPRVVLSLYVGRQMSLDALNKATEEGGQVFLATQKSPDTDEPAADDLYAVGCVANVLQILRLPDGTVKVLVEGLSRAKAVFRVRAGEAIMSEVKTLATVNRPREESAMAMRRAFLSQLESYAKINAKVGHDLLAKIKDIDDLARLVDHVVSFSPWIFASARRCWRPRT